MTLLKYHISEINAGSPLPTTSNILFVVSNPGTPETRDSAITAIMTNAGHTVTYIDDNTVTSGDASGYDAILISASATNANVNGIFASTATPLWVMSSTEADNHNMTSGAGSTGFTQEINIDDNSHPVTTGFATGALDILTSNTGLLQATSYGSGTAIASEVGTPANKTIIYWDAGVAMAIGNAPAKRLVCVIAGQAGQRLEINGETLVTNAVNWLIT